MMSKLLILFVILELITLVQCQTAVRITAKIQVSPESFNSTLFALGIKPYLKWILLILIQEVAQVLCIPSIAISDVSVDNGKSNNSSTIIMFSISNSDGLNVRQNTTEIPYCD